MTLYQKYKSLKIDKSYINLEEGNEIADWFCTPIGARVIGWENGIHYCFIEGFGDMVFAVNPEGSINKNGEELHTYPLAKSFEDFLRLILAAKCANHLEQIIHFSKSEFERFCEDDGCYLEFKKKREEVLDVIAKELNINPMKNVYEYVNNLQKGFDTMRIKYSDDYYDTLGLERPNGTKRKDSLFEFDAVSISIGKK